MEMTYSHLPRGLHIAGVVAPYNIKGAWDEMLLPGAFSAFLAKHANDRLPMLLGHVPGHEIGYWSRFWDSPEGLCAEGWITDPRAVAVIQDEHIRNTSINYFKNDSGKPVQMSFKRVRASLYAQLRAFEGRVIPVPLDVVDCIGADQMDEVSITAAPAYPGTHFEVLPA